jgi:hypothetical protein
LTKISLINLQITPIYTLGEHKIPNFLVAGRSKILLKKNKKSLLLSAGDEGLGFVFKILNPHSPTK